MKKLTFVFLLLLLPVLLQAQTKYDTPSKAVVDTLSGAVALRVTQDIYFNTANDSSGTTWNYGIIDLNTLADVTTSDDDGALTVTVEVYGIVKMRFGRTQDWTSDITRSHFIDSTRVGTISATTTATMNTFEIDPLFDNFSQYDGIRVVYKKGADADVAKLWTQVRIYIPDERHFY